MTVIIEASIDHSDVMVKLSKLAAKGTNLRPVMKAFGDHLIKETVTRFEQESDPEGKSWEVLSDFTLASKKNTQILSESTDLRNSFSRKAAKYSVKMGSDRLYAAVHQFGLKKELKIKSHAVKAQTRKAKGRNKRGIQSGVAFHKAHTRKAHARKVNIPARPFLGFTDHDRVELAETVKEYLLQE